MQVVHIVLHMLDVEEVSYNLDQSIPAINMSSSTTYLTYSIAHDRAILASRSCTPSMLNNIPA